MEIIEGKKLKYYLLGAKYIGKGRCAFCFLMKNGKVLKVYYNSQCTRDLFCLHEYKMLDLFTFLNGFNNQTFYGPEDIFMNEQVAAYTMEYADGRLAKDLDTNLTISELNNLFTVLEEDVIEASERNLELKDIHQKNIIIGENIKIVDLDFCMMNRKPKTDRFVQFNYRKLIPVLTKALFKVSDNRDVLFYDRKLQNLFIQAIYQDYLAYYEFLEALMEHGETVHDLRKAKLVYSKIHVNYNNKGII